MAFGDAADGRHDLPGGTEAALQAVVLNECALERMKLTVLLETLDRFDCGPVMHRRQRQTRHDPPAVEQDGASTAGALITALLRAGETEVFAQNVEKGLPHVQLKLVPLPVHCQANP